jgi:hypothetical protein
MQTEEPHHVQHPFDHVQHQFDAAESCWYTYLSLSLSLSLFLDTHTHTHTHTHMYIVNLGGLVFGSERDQERVTRVALRATTSHARSKL